MVRRTILLLPAIILPVIGRIARAELASAPSRSGSDIDKTAAVVVLQGTIDEFNRDQLFKRFAEARAAGATTAILRIDTYGGLVTAGLDISRFIKRQTDLHTIAFVDDK